MAENPPGSDVFHPEGIKAISRRLRSLGDATTGNCMGSAMKKESKLQIDSSELDDKAVCRDFRQTAEDGNCSGFPNSSKGGKERP